MSELPELPSPVKDDSEEGLEGFPDLPSPIDFPSDGELANGLDGGVEPELPTDVNTNLCCNRNCMRVFADVVKEYRTERTMMDRKRHGALLYDVMKRCFLDGNNNFMEGRVIPYIFNGERCCRHFFAFANQCTHATIEKYKGLLKLGHVTLPEPKPTRSKHSSGLAGGEQMAKADAWFFQLWCDIGEHDPTSQDEMLFKLDTATDDLPELTPIDDQAHPLFAVALNMEGGRNVQVRKLNPGRFEDLFCMHKHLQGDDAVSRTTLRACWQARWKNIRFVSRYPTSPSMEASCMT